MALIAASNKGQMEVVRLLLAHPGVDLNLKDKVDPYFDPTGTLFL